MIRETEIIVAAKCEVSMSGYRNACSLRAFEQQPPAVQVLSISTPQLHAQVFDQIIRHLHSANPADLKAGEADEKIRLNRMKPQLVKKRFIPISFRVTSGK